MTVNWKANPTFTITGKNLRQPADIIQIFKNHKSAKYIYRIKYKGIVIKFGMSAATSLSKIWGERVYRQIAHCLSWGALRIVGSSGADWMNIDHAFTAEYGIKLDHKDLTISVWDFTNYEFKSFNQIKEINVMESELINDYINVVGTPPIGNINTESNKLDIPYVSVDHWNSMFDSPAKANLTTFFTAE